MENNKQLGPLYQMETFSDSAGTSPPMHYNNGSEAVTVVFKLPLSQLGFRSDNLATETAPSLSWRELSRRVMDVI